MALGTYRLHVRGTRYVGGDETWPWTGAPYEVLSPSFEVVPAELTLSPDAGGLWVSLRAPADGYRLIELDGSSQGDNPVHGPLEVTLQDGEDIVTRAEEAGRTTEGRTWLEVDTSTADTITVTDAYGNIGTLSLR